MKLLSFVRIVVVLQALGLFISCAPKRIAMPVSHAQEIIGALKQDVSIVYMPHSKREPAHLVVNKRVHYNFSTAQQQAFVKDITIDPLMNKLKMSAQVLKHGKVLREYTAYKTTSTVLNNNKNMLSPTRAKLSLVVPFLNADEELIVSSSYYWMEPRWHWPIFMQEAEPTAASCVTIDIPYGISLRFSAARDGEHLALVPSNQAHNNPLWTAHDNPQGQGTRFVFADNFAALPSVKPAYRQQLLLAFAAPAMRDQKALFDNWHAVGAYLYDRIDRYDVPSHAIRDFSVELVAPYEEELEKIAAVLSFLNHDIEKTRVAEAFYQYEAQPASRTFARRGGSPSDIALLGKAMLTSIGVNAELIAVADAEHNPHIEDFFSPALFRNMVIALNTKAQTFYYDPRQSFDRFDQVPPALQGQAALLLRPSASRYFVMPHDDPAKNQARYVYDLKLNSLGTLEGSFALELSGIKADQAKAVLAAAHVLSASTLQKQLNADNALIWQQASLHEHEEEASDSVSFSGHFAPLLLKRAEQSSTQSPAGFVLPIREIFAPLLALLMRNKDQEFSSSASLEASIEMPAPYVLSEPLSLFVEHDSRRARFMVSLESQTVVLRGESMLSFPIKQGFDHVSLAWPDEKQAIIEIAGQIGEKHEATKEQQQDNAPPAPKNS